MPLLFSYGTLQQQNVQLSKFGRLLHGHKDELIGFEQSFAKIEDPQVAAASGKTHHADVTCNGRNDSRVSGTVFEISDAELAAADQYEQLAAICKGKFRGTSTTVVAGNGGGFGSEISVKRSVAHGPCDPTRIFCSSRYFRLYFFHGEQ